MSDKIILSHNPDAGITQYWEYDRNTDEYVLHTVQDVRHILEANKAEYAADKPSSRRRFGRKVGSVPLGLWWQMRQDGTLRDQKKLKRFLNDNEFRFFRTTDETV